MARYSNHLENAILKNSNHYQEGEKGREGSGGGGNLEINLPINITHQSYLKFY